MMNRTVLVGRLTRDPELKYTPGGVAVATFTLACDRPFTNQDGERETDFIRCVVFRRPAENVANYLKKGSLAGVDGRISTRSFEGQDGKRVHMTEVAADRVQFLDSSSDNRVDVSPPKTGGQGTQRTQQPQSNRNQANPAYSQPSRGGQSGPINISDDDLPF